MDDDSQERAQSDTVCCQHGSELLRLIRAHAGHGGGDPTAGGGGVFPVATWRRRRRRCPMTSPARWPRPQAAAAGRRHHARRWARRWCSPAANLIARLPDAPESGAVRLCAHPERRPQPADGRRARPDWDSDESDAYTISGRRLVASLAQVGEAWQRRLLDHPTDRNGRA